MKEKLTQQQVDDFFSSHFTRSSHDNETLVHKFTYRYSPIGPSVTSASFNLSKSFDIDVKSFEKMCITAFKKLSYVNGEDLMNMYKANKPIWDIFEKNISNEWKPLSDIKAAYKTVGYNDRFMERLSMWADETGRKVNIKRIGLTRKIISSKPTKELPWSKR